MPDVAEPVLAGDDGRRAAAGVGEDGSQLAHGPRGAAADVVRAQRSGPVVDTSAGDRLERGGGGAGHVAHVNEVPSLRAVLEDPRRAAGLQEERKNDATPAYGVSRGIPGPYTL